MGEVLRLHRETTTQTHSHAVASGRTALWNKDKADFFSAVPSSRASPSAAVGHDDKGLTETGRGACGYVCVCVCVSGGRRCSTLLVSATTTWVTVKSHLNIKRQQQQRQKKKQNAERKYFRRLMRETVGSLRGKWDRSKSRFTPQLPPPDPSSQTQQNFLHHLHF